MLQLTGARALEFPSVYIVEHYLVQLLRHGCQHCGVIVRKQRVKRLFQGSCVEPGACHQKSLVEAGRHHGSQLHIRVAREGGVLPGEIKIFFHFFLLVPRILGLLLRNSSVARGLRRGSLRLGQLLFRRAPRVVDCLEAGQVVGRIQSHHVVFVLADPLVILLDLVLVLQMEPTFG